MQEKLFAKSGLSFERLRTFAQIVQARGMTLAAKGDPTRQSQFSRQLKELEQFFGVELIRRGHGRFSLTASGRLLHRLVGEYFGALAELKAVCDRQPVELSIGAGESVLHWLVLPRLARMQEAVPKSVFVLQNLQTEEIVGRLLDGQIDFGILRRDAARKSLKTAPLVSLRYSLFAPRRSLTHLKERPVAEWLGVLPLAVLEGRNRVNDVLEAETGKRGQRLNIQLRCSSYTQAAEAVNILGTAAVLPTGARAMFDPEEVEEINFPFLTKLSRPVVLAWSARLAAIRPAVATAARVLPAILADEARSAGKGQT